MATLPAATQVTRAGLTVSGARVTASASSDKFANNGKQMLLVRNGDTGAHVLTFPTPSTVEAVKVDGLTIQDPTVSVAAGESKLIGPFKPSLFNDTNGFVTVNSDIVTGQTVEVLQVDTVVNQ